MNLKENLEKSGVTTQKTDGRTPNLVQSKD